MNGQPLYDRLRARGPRAVVVMGVSGSGKSTLGAKLAASLHAPFLEGDEFHPSANLAKMRAQIALEDADRWPWLDELGRVMGVTAREHGLDVAACSALKHSYRDRLRRAAGVPILFVCLQADPAVIAARMNQRRSHFMPASLLSSQLAILEPPDASEDALCVSAAEPIEQTVRLATAALVTWAADDHHGPRHS